MTVLARLALAVVLGFALAGCRSCRKPPVESTVDVPVTLEGVCALHAPPKTTVAVERMTQTGGGGGCGHSPACLIVVPIILYQAVFPTQYDLATVTEDGIVTYSGMFRTNGEFIQARARKGAEARDLRMLDMAKLGKRVVVVVARASIGSDGKEGTFTPTPLLPQVDLVAEYRAALAKATKPRDRGELLNEALAWLGEEGLPFLRERLASPDEPDSAKAVVVEGICNAFELAVTTGARPAGMDAALAAARDAPGPLTSAAALRCYWASDAPDIEGARPFLTALVRHACGATGDVCAAEKVLSARGPLVASAVAADVDRCDSEPRRTLLRLGLGQPVAAEAIAAALAADTGPCLAPRLVGERPEHRRALALALRSEALAKSASRAEVQLAAVETLHSARAEPNADELDAVAVAYPQRSTALLSFDTSRDRRRRSTSLALFARGRSDALRNARARERLHAALPTSKESDRPSLHVALVTLGENAQALAAARGVEPAELGKGVPHEPGDLSEGRLIAFGLHLAGRSDEEVLELVKHAHGGGAR